MTRQRNMQRSIATRLAEKLGLREFGIVLRYNKKALTGLVIIVALIFIAIAAPILAPYNPFAITGAPYEPPSKEHPLGTDDVGHDILSQLIYGSRTSLLVGFLGALGVTIVGVLIGLVAGFAGGWVDETLMRLTDIVLVIPYIVFVIVLVAYLGPSIWNIIISITILGWPTIARMVRSYVLSLKNSLYIEAARSFGASNLHIMRRHVLPGLIPLVLPVYVLTIVDSILTEAGLSFLGLGDPTHPSWGLLLYYAQIRGAFVRGMWWWIIPPGLMITLTGLGFLLFGISLEEYFNPRLRSTQ